MVSLQREVQISIKNTQQNTVQCSSHSSQIYLTRKYSLVHNELLCQLEDNQATGTEWAPVQLIWLFNIKKMLLFCMKVWYSVSYMVWS